MGTRRRKMRVYILGRVGCWRRHQARASPFAFLPTAHSTSSPQLPHTLTDMFNLKLVVLALAAALIGTSSATPAPTPIPTGAVLRRDADYTYKRDVASDTSESCTLPGVGYGSIVECALTEALFRSLSFSFAFCDISQTCTGSRPHPHRQGLVLETVLCLGGSLRFHVRDLSSKSSELFHTTAD